jgi:hypothetical protein
MDGSRFDTLVRTLAIGRLTRVQTLRGLAVGVLPSFTGLSLIAEVGAKNKGKGKGKKTRRRRRKNKKKLVCTCSAAGCTQHKVTNPASLITQNPRCNYAGACTTNPCAAVPPPPCLPEPQATTCAAGCGPRLNNCNQSISCPCPGGQTCLPNGTCARSCTTNPQCAGCTQARVCATTSEGQSICIVIPPTCGILQPCPVTMSCPKGSACVACGMAGLRCVQVGVCP